MARRAALGAIFLTIFVDLVGFGMIIPLIALYGQSLGASADELVILGGTYSLMQFLFAPFWGSLSDRMGRRPVLLLSISGNVVALLLFGLADHIWLLIAARALSGIFAANIAAAQAYVADITPPERRAQGMGLVGAAFGLGFTLGPPLGGLCAYYFGLSSVGFAAAALAFLNLVAATIFLGESLPKESRRDVATRSWLNPDGLALIRSHHLIAGLLLVFFVVTFGFSNFEQSFMLRFRDALDIPSHHAGFYASLILGWIGIVGVIIQGGCIKHLVRRFGETPLIYAGLSGYIFAFLLFPFMRTYAQFFAPATILAVGSSLLNPTLAAQISHASPTDRQGAILGITQGVGSLARALGPMSGLWLYYIHFSYPFFMAAAVSLIVVAIFFAVGRRSASTPS